MASSSSATAGPSSQPPPAPAPPAAPPTTPKQPVVIITIGMAGSGKTTLVQRLNSYLHTPSATRPDPRAPYIVNLDPAVTQVPFEANVDIRDTVNYREVMKQYNLGPNGGILTALNLFTTKFDQVLALLEKRAPSVDYVILDTPGQIEIFTWSASGAIITDAVAASFPTVVAYVIDTPRTTAPATFMSNMLYACSILYKTRLPFLLVFNKTDVQPHDFAIEWMRDFETYQEALAAGNSQDASGAQGESTYMNSLMNSMSLVLDEFYKHLRTVGVSAMTGNGMPEFFAAVEEARKEYEAEYRPELERLHREKAEKDDARKKDSMDRFMKDLKLDEQKPWEGPGPDPRRDTWDDADGEYEEDEEEDEDGEAEEENDEDEEEEGPDMPNRRQQGSLMSRARRTQENIKWPRPG